MFNLLNGEVNTVDNLLNELDCFELTNEKATQTYMIGEEEEVMPPCPLHFGALLEKTDKNQNGDVFVRCSKRRDCMMFCCESELKSYLHSIKAQLHTNHKNEAVMCFCVVLQPSR